MDRETAAPARPAPEAVDGRTDVAARPRRAGLAELLPYLAVGIYFGLVITKSEVISWFRIQEMFRFQGFHMYGVLFSAVGVAAVSVALIRRLGLRSRRGEEIRIAPKECHGRNTRYWLGGTSFGLGWGLLGACPGPIYALIGTGLPVFIVALAAALAGTWTYGALQGRLPHY